MKFKLTFWKSLFAIVMILGVYSTYVRFFKGLGAVSNMNDEFPWGIWIGFDLLCGVMLAAGGFCVTAAVYLLNIKRLHDIVRPAVLTAFLGYLLFIVGLMFDLGRPYNIWHPLIMYNVHSVMFEVGWCVMCYTTVLFLEFLPAVLEKFKWYFLLKVVKLALVPLVILGILFSTLHQSSLGSLYLIMPTKLHAFWYSPALPFFFFSSAICVGLAMTILESTLSSRVFGRQLELSVLVELGGALLIAECVYALLRFEDYFHRGQLKSILHPSYESYFLWFELLFAIVIPIGILSFKKMRTSANGLYWASVCALLGFVTNRLNVSITGLESWAHHHYVPKWTEFSITAAIVAMEFFLFAMAVKYLPIFPEQEHAAASAPVAEPEPVAQMAHAGH